MYVHHIGHTTEPEVQITLLTPLQKELQIKLGLVYDIAGHFCSRKATDSNFVSAHDFLRAAQLYRLNSKAIKERFVMCEDILANAEIKWEDRGFTVPSWKSSSIFFLFHI